MSYTNPQEEFTAESLKDKLKISTARHTDSVKGKWGFFWCPVNHDGYISVKSKDNQNIHNTIYV